MNNVNKRNLIKRFVERQTVVVLILITLIAVSCNEDGLLGLEVQPDGQYDTITLTDSFSVRAFTLEGERQRSDEAQSYIGRLQSDEFGSTESALILNFSLITGNTVIELNGYTVDSVVLHLRPNEIYGVPKDEVPIDIYRVNEVLDIEGDYYSDFSPEIGPTPAASAVFKYPRQIKSTDTIRVAGEPEPFQFRIPLDVSIGQELLSILIDQSATDTKSFQSIFNGFMIKPTEGGMSADATGAIYSLALLTGESGIRLYVSNGTDSEVLKYPINSQCARVNQYQHDYLGSLAETYLNDSKDNDDILFVQGLSGLRSEIHIPGLYNFGKMNNTAIAKAVLQFQLSDKQHSELGNSFRLFLLDLDADNSESLTLDYVYSPNRSGGRYDEETNGYEFDITRHVQRIVDAARIGEDLNYGLRLHAQVPVLNGNDTAHNMIQGFDNIALKLYHTDLNN